MEKDLIYTLKVNTAECFNCKEIFNLYDEQKLNINFCNICNPNKALTTLVSLPNVIKKIVSFAEQQNKKINDRLVVDIADLVTELQRGQ